MSLQQIARKNLIASCIKNGCCQEDIRHHLSNRAGQVAAIRRERYERKAFFLSGEMPWSRREWGWWNSRRSNTFAKFQPLHDIWA